MATEEDVAASLIAWVNSLHVTDPFYTVDELATGEVLWKLLQLIDHVSFPGQLPEDPTRIDSTKDSSWIQRWTNLKHVYDALSIFLIEECEQQLPLFYSHGTGQLANPDLKAIAQHGSLDDAVILLRLCVVAATNCADNERFVQPMARGELPDGVMKILAETIQEAQENNEEEHDGIDHEDRIEETEETAEEDDSFQQEPLEDLEHETIDQRKPAEASDLAFEERLAKVIADSQRITREKHELQRHINELNSKYNSLHQRHDRTQDDLAEANDRLTAVLSGRSTDAKKSSEAQKEAIIADLESQLVQYETDIEGLRKNNEVLKIKAERVQKLQDDYDEIKIERDNMSRKANAAEKYRQKLEAIQDQEKENITLKQKVTDLQSQLRQSDTRTASTSDLQREIDEYRRLLPQLEQERHEVNEMKKRLEFDYHLLEARYSESEEQLRRSRQEVEDLQGRLREYDDGDEVAPRGRRSDVELDVETQDLESEEAAYERAEARLQEALLKNVAAIEPADGDSTAATSAVTEQPSLEGLGIDLDENGISEDELRAIMSAMRAQMAAGTTLERESSLEMQKKMVIMLEKARTRNQALVDHVRQQASQIEEMKQRPEAVPDEATPAKEPKSESEMEQQLEEQDVLIENLKREIRLISSAWYEQNQRLATLGSGSGGGGAVALMRLKGGVGLEEPKSFLGKQRKMLDRVAVGSQNPKVRATRT